MVEEFHKPTGQPTRGRLQLDHKFIHSIYFHDPNGIALEASVWITNPTGQLPDYANPHVFQYEDPAPALREEMERARLGESS